MLDPLACAAAARVTAKIRSDAQSEEDLAALTEAVALRRAAEPVARIKPPLPRTKTVVRSYIYGEVNAAATESPRFSMFAWWRAGGGSPAAKDQQGILPSALAAAPSAEVITVSAPGSRSHSPSRSPLPRDVNNVYVHARQLKHHKPDEKLQLGQRPLLRV